MANNFTPLVVSEIEKKQSGQKSPVISKKNSFDFNIIFLSLVVITLTVLVVLLFLLIQKKMQELSLVPLYFA